MDEKDIVSQPIAIIAKEVGFSTEGRHQWAYDLSVESEKKLLKFEDDGWNLKHPDVVYAPTREELHRWLREEHKLYVHHYTLYAETGEVFWGVDVYDITKGHNKLADDYSLFSSEALFRATSNKAALLNTYEDAYTVGLAQACIIVKLRKDGQEAQQKITKPAK